MADLMRHTAVWSGTPGLPGYSQFYHSISDPVLTSAQEGSDTIALMFAQLSGLIPADITVTVDPLCQILNEATGEVSSEVSTPTPASAGQGSYAGGWSAQVGVMVEWITGAFVAGRRLRGRTYLVPLGSVGDADGTLTSAMKATIEDATWNIVDSSEDFRVWHRPKGAVPGSSASISSRVVRDHAAMLRSRML